MEPVNLILLGEIIVACATMAIAALYALSRVEDRQRRRDPSLFSACRRTVVFLFEDEELVDATTGARQLLAATARDGTAWARMVRILLPRFPTLPEDMSRLVDAGTIVLTSTDGRSRIEAEWRQGLARLTLIDVERQDTGVMIDKLALTSLEDELATLRAITDQVPYMTWKELPGGRIVWANAAYLDASERFGGDGPVQAWPPHPVFPAQADSDGARRASVRFPGDRQDSWFEIRDLDMGDGVLRSALPADAVVHAERSRTEFVQTLTKTFANLTVGLAIFDRNRKLQLFNPALTDLTGLAAEFLVQRPSLASFIDRLRDARILPEPKNFDSWRQRISALESAAERGTYEETWTLPDGQIFQVTGRPHPDGAIALLIEDVSAEMLLTRRFKTDLQLCQSVFDSLDPAMAVFAADGGLTLANAAYCRMWSIDSRAATRQVTLASSLRHWRTDAPTTPDWARLTEAGRTGTLPRPLQFTAERLTGRRLDCRFTPLPGGALLAGFAEDATPPHPVFRHQRLRDLQLS